MGRDKALLVFAGRPLIAHALFILAEAGLPASIAGGDPAARASLSAYAPVVKDAQPGLGPLGGICAALASAATPHAVFLSIDLPFVPPSLVAYLLHHAQITGRAVTLCSVVGFAQTFPVVVDRAALPALQAELAAGRNGCFSAFQTAAASLGQPPSVLPAELLAQTGNAADPSGFSPNLWFLNLNSPADLARGEALHSRRAPHPSSAWVG